MSVSMATRAVAAVLAVLALAWSAPAQAQPKCTTKPGWHYAASEAVLDMAGRFVAQGDKAAFDKLIQSGLLQPMKGGVAVYLESGGSFGHAAIRLPGELRPVWTLTEALSCAR